MKTVALTVLSAVGTVVIIAAQGAPDLEVVQVRPNVYMLAGAGGNIVVQVGEDGAVVVDAGSPGSAAAVVAAIRKLGDNPIRYVINTGPDADHVGGNAALAKAGQTLFFQRSIGLPNDFLGAGAASILAVESVLTRMSGAGPGTQAYPADAWPTETFDYARKYMYLNGEGIEVLHQPAAHTDHLWSVLSMALVGLAGVLAGGCPVRQVVMAGEGNGDAFVATIGILLGAAVATNLGAVSGAHGATAAGQAMVVGGLVVALAYAALSVRSER